MKNSTVDINMYIKGDTEKAMVGIMSVGGIIRANVNARVRRLLDIEYDPGQTSSQSILNAVKQRGCSATLVGM